MSLSDVDLQRMRISCMRLCHWHRTHFTNGISSISERYTESGRADVRGRRSDQFCGVTSDSYCWHAPLRDEWRPSLSIVKVLGSIQRPAILSEWPHSGSRCDMCFNVSCSLLFVSVCWRDVFERPIDVMCYTRVWCNRLVLKKYFVVCSKRMCQSHINIIGADLPGYVGGNSAEGDTFLTLV